MSAIATNGRIKSGGRSFSWFLAPSHLTTPFSYYIISRYLGPEFGGAAGILFSIAMGVATSMEVLGFVEVFQAIFPNATIVEGWDMQIMGTILALILFAIVFAGMKLVWCSVWSLLSRLA